MEKQYFSPERDGFYGVYYPNPVPSGKAMIAMLGDSSDDHMVKSGAKWLHKHGCNVMAMSPDKKDYGHHDYPLERIDRAIEVLKAQGNQKIGIVGASTTGMVALVSASLFPEITLNIKSKAGKELYCFFFTGFFYLMMADPGPLRTRFLCKVTGRTLEEANRLLYRRATWKSWKNQDYCLIGKRMDYSVFGRTDMHLWYGIKCVVDKKMSANLEKLKEQGYPFQYKIFTELGHGGLAGEKPKRLLSEMTNAHERQKEG